jgi:hypothetical protein
VPIDDMSMTEALHGVVFDRAIARPLKRLFEI